MLPPLLQIDNYLVSTDLITEYFACDYPVCRGARCIVGESGAPMDILDACGNSDSNCPDGLYSNGDCPDGLYSAEGSALAGDYPKYSGLMTQAGRDAVARQGFFTVDRDGDTVTPLVAGGEECAFCHFEGEGISRNCLCAIEMSGCTKPVSCSLYPIRIRHLKSGMTAVNLHRWEICKPAFAKGKREKVRVYEFLRGPIERAFGKDFYEALDAAAKLL